MALGAALLAACAAQRAPRTDRDAETGEQLFQKACASCHGLDARGGGPVAPQLREPVPDLTSLATRHGGRFPRQYVLDVIVGKQELPAHGTREMPVWSERFGSGPGLVASWYARRRDELLADHLAALQR
jgi:mono/diheme cytochrome c family protein